MNCPFCGASINEGNNMCPHCLKRLDDVESNGATALKDVTPPPTPGNDEAGKADGLHVQVNVQQPYGQNPYAQQPYGQNPYAQQPYGQNPYAAGYKPPQPPSHLVGSILNALFCCQPGGIISIIFSALSMSKYSSGEYEDSEKFSRWAGTINRLCFFGFFLLVLLIIVLAVTGALEGVQ